VVARWTMANMWLHSLRHYITDSKQLRNRAMSVDLFVVGQSEDGAERAVAIVTEQNDARLFRCWIEHIEMWRMPAGVDRDTKINVTQHARVRVVHHLHTRCRSLTCSCLSLRITALIWLPFLL